MAVVRPCCLFAALACTLMWCAPPARAETADDCAPRLRAVLNVSPNGVPLVTLMVNGAATHLLLDTGAEQTTLTDRAARRLGLLTDFDHTQTMRGIGGNVSAGLVQPDLVTGGGRKLPGLTFAVVAVTLPPVGEQQVDGLLGADMLGAYDLDIDLGHHLIKLYDPSACPVPTLPWRRTYDEVVGQYSRHKHLAFPIVLDGHKLTAFIDTGAQITLIDAGAATRMGLTEAALAVDDVLPMQGVSTQVVTAREHRFARLGIADGVLLSPVVGVMPLRLDDADLLMGADVLRRQRIWLSYASRRIFVARPE
jgi:predicted aspartyl protease